MLKDMFSRGVIPILEKVVEFTEQRHAVLAHNIANIDTPFYQRYDLDVAGFMAMLRSAVTRRRNEPGQPVQFQASSYLRLDPQGRLIARPFQPEGTDILFHDESNRNAEQEMAEVAKNTMWHNLAISLLKNQFETLTTAIRGRL